DPIEGNFADFPTLGLDEDGLYLAAYMFDKVRGTNMGNTLVSIPKTNLLAAIPNVSNLTWFGILNAALYGNVLQPSVSLGNACGQSKVLAMGDLGYDFHGHSNLVSFAVQNTCGPGPATLDPPTLLSVPAYWVPINPTQPDGNNTLDDGDARL